MLSPYLRQRIPHISFGSEEKGIVLDLVERGDLELTSIPYSILVNLDNGKTKKFDLDVHLAKLVTSTGRSKPSILIFTTSLCQPNSFPTEMDLRVRLVKFCLSLCNSFDRPLTRDTYRLGLVYQVVAHLHYSPFLLLPFLEGRFFPSEIGSLCSFRS